MHEWQRLLLRGNMSFECQDWLTAEYCYQTAFDLLEDKWMSHQESHELLMAWICACHNLSAVYESQGDLTVAARYLLIPHTKVQGLANDIRAPRALSALAIKAINTTMSPILSFMKTHPMCDECKRELLAASLFSVPAGEALH